MKRAIVVVLVFSPLWLALIDVMCGTSENVAWRVVQKSFTAPSTGVGPSLNGKGGVAVTFHPASWTLIIEDGGDVDAVNVDRQTWARYENGDTYYRVKRTGWTGLRY